MSEKPDIIVILNDDMGYSDIGCYGGEVETPNLDSLARNGLRLTQFYNTARCCPSRASLLTGLYPHQADVGHMVGNDDVDGYLGDLSWNAATLAEALKPAGYATAMSGKWHVTGHLDAPGNWPCQRGFDSYYGMLCGAASYFDPHHLKRNNESIRLEPGQYFTDAISDEAVSQLKAHHAANPDQPFFQYVAYTAPHWPLHALPEDMEKYEGRFAAGWDELREKRLARMREMGTLQSGWELSPRDPNEPAWADAENKEWQQKRMEAYAAQIDRMDQGIGRLLDALRETGRLDNTLILFLADNGGCAEVIGPRGEKIFNPWRASGREFTRDGRPVRYGNQPDIVPGPEDTYASYGRAWANLSNTPFRKYKVWTHEGGISTPFIVHWPAGLTARNELRHQPAQLPDVMATLLDYAGAAYPERIGDRTIQPCEGHSMRPIFERDAPHGREVLYWEHEGNAAVRRGKWKLVRDYPAAWELYDIEADRSEVHDLASQYPEVVRELDALWHDWAQRIGVWEWNELLERRKARR
jgi:arylsulfatase A-like enzyme